MSNETSENLRRNVPRILAEWEVQAHKSILSSRGLTSLVLKNGVQSFLEQLTDALSMSIDRTEIRVAQDSANFLNFAKIHGGERATESLHYTLAEVILEFQILQRVILDILEENDPISAIDRKIIIVTIGNALIGAATRFADVHKDVDEQFALTLVHDLRSPINFVKMSAYLIKHDAAASKQTQRAAEKIDQNMDRLEAMLKEVLDVGRLRSGLGLAFELKDVRLDLLAKEVVDEMNETYDNEFQLDIKEPVSGYWNRAGLRRVFENLIINAVKYGSPKTPIKVSVSQNASHATFIVHNDGNPIPAEEQPKLFDEFQRSSTATSQTGWGLGLALVNGMVKAHRGGVRVTSEPAMGTDFIVELPKKV